MSDHKFEKKVGQKLDDLKLTPSAKSWENIERELRKDRRRPAPVFWLPLLLLGLGAIGYFVFRGDEKNNDTVLAKNENITAYNKGDDKELEAQQTEKGGRAGEIENSVKVENTENSLSPEVSKPQEPVIAAAQRPVSRWRERPSGAATYNNKKTAARSRVDRGQLTNRPSSPLASLGVLPPAGDNSPRAPLEQSKPQQKIELTEQPKEDKIEEKAEKKTEQKTEEKSESIEQPATPKAEKKKSKKWSFGISGTGGVSSLSEGKLSFNNSQIATVPLNRAPSYSFASPAVVPPPSAPPSKIYPALSFGFGLTTKYELSKRFVLSSGVNYLQLNTISKVGYKFEQTSNQTNPGISQDRSGAEVMYLPPAGEQTRDYDNKYHFIEVPLNLHTRINKSEKLPLYWNAGISVSKLIKSNSLHYDEVEHLYYSNDELLKKTQTAISTGFSFVVFNKTSTPLWIGPTVRYNISQAFKNEIHAGNKHFMGVGLDVKWFLK